MADKVEKIREEVERLMNELIQEKGKCFDSDADDACILELQNVLTFIDSLQEEPVKSVWHDVKEKPIYKNGLIENQIAVYGITTTGESMSVCSLIDESTIYAPINGKEYTWGTCPFTKWAYATDLLNLSNSCNYGNNWKEEHGSEELEEAAIEYCGGNKGSDARVRTGFIMGAKWQNAQFEKNHSAACDKQTEEEAEIERDFIKGIIGNEHRMPTFDDAIKYGMRLQKKQMMAKAIDVKINRDTLYDLKPFIHEKYLDYKMGDKCKMILIKEDRI